MEIWQAVILGLVEGITEYLPISSTGHLIIASQLMGLKSPELRQAVSDFEIVIQGGAILAVVGIYWPRLLQMLRGLIGRDAAGLRLFINLVIAFVPSAVLGLALNKWIKANLFSTGPVLAALALGAAYMLIVEAWHRSRPRAMVHDPRVPAAVREMELTDVSPVQALFIGLLQCFALWPGTSRSMMTITGGYLVGLTPARAAEFSFLLGLPTLTAATAYSLYKNLKNAHENGVPNLFEQLGVAACTVGMLVAAISAAFAVRWLVRSLNQLGLTPFGYYRLALCLVMLLLAWRGIIQIGA